VKFHVITGLPRSGTTLLCNIFNQNPRCYASSTSPLPVMLNNLVHAWSSAPEIKSMLEKQKDETELRMEAAARATIDGWYAHKDNEIIFDKSRSWSASSLMLKKVYPECKMIVCVRNLLNVFASVEKQHMKNPLLDEADSLNDRTVYNRADTFFGPEGLIGQPIVGIEDILRRNPDNVIFVHYETFTTDPAMAMQRIYTELNEPLFEHDFDNVKNTAEDADGFYLHKYPHRGCGKVAPTDPEEWKKYISPDLAGTIMGRFQDYCKSFGYSA